MVSRIGANGARVGVSSTHGSSPRGGFLSTLVGNGLYSASQLLMLATLAKQGTTADVGIFSLAYAVTAPAFLLANLKVRQIFVSDVGDDFSYQHYLGVRLLSTSLVWSTLCITALFWFASPVITCIIATLKAIELISDTYLAASHKRGDLLRGNVTLAFRGILGSLAFITTLILGGTLTSALTAMAPVYVCVALVDAQAARRYEAIRPSFRRDRLWPLFRLSVPLGIALALSSASAMSPRYALGLTHGTESVAQYSVAAYFLSIGAMAINALGQSHAPLLAREFARGGWRAMGPHVRHLQWISMGLSMSLLMAAIFTGKWALGALYGANYVEAWLPLVILAASTIPSYLAVFYGSTLNAMRNFRVSLPITVTSGIATGATALLLASAWGPLGAAIAVCLGASIELVCYATIVERAARARTDQIGHPDRKEG